MAARNVRARVSPNRLGASDDVISISSDSDSEFNMSDDDESLPSISALLLSMPRAGLARTESIGEHSHGTDTVLASSRRGITKSEGFARGSGDISAVSSPNSPMEPGFPSRSHFGHPAKTSKPTEFVDDSKKSTFSTRDQHNAGMSFSSCSSKQKSSVESVSGRRLFVEGAALEYQSDKGPHYQHTNPFHQAAPVCRNRPSIVSPNECIPVHGGDADHGRRVVAMPPSDTKISDMARSVFTQVSKAEHATGALAQGNSAGSDQQESAHDNSPCVTYSGLSSDQRRQESRQTTTNVDNTASQLEAPGNNPQSQVHSHRNPKSGYNLRPSPVKRRYGGEGLVTGKVTTSTQPEKRLKLGGSKTDASVFQMDSLLVRWRKHIFLVKWYDHPGAVVTTWEPRKNILDKRMLVDFEAKWRGFDAGVDVLGTRRRGGKRQYLLHWHGRPSKEDTWLNEDLLSPQLMDRNK